jgi:hypothetical protein
MRDRAMSIGMGGKVMEGPTNSVATVADDRLLKSTLRLVAQ